MAALTSHNNSSAAVHIAVIATSDVHGNLWGYRYEDEAETENDGLARISTYVAEVRNSGSNVILLDNGDTYQGNILTDDLFNKKTDTVHPVSLALNAMGYDAMTLGNHDFNFGLGLVDKMKAELSFPVLAANVKREDGGSFAEAYTIVETQGVKVGIIGLTNPNVPRWDGDKVKGLSFGHMAETAQELTRKLKSDGLADLVIISAHAGMIAEFDEEGGSDSAERIAELVPEADALIVGHMHMTVQDRIGNMVIGGPRNGGREAVRLDFTVSMNGGRPQVTERSAAVIDMAGYTPDPALRELLREAHEETITFTAEGGGAPNSEMSGGILGVAEADFLPPDEIRGIPEAKLRDTAIVKLIQKVLLKYSGADVCSTPLFRETADLKQGNITYANVFNLYPFDNQLYVVKVTGKELKRYMESAAAHYNQWQPGDVSISFNPEMPGFLYDMFAGVDYRIDLSQPEGSRIRDVRYKGKPLADDDTLNLAVNNYRYSSLLKASKIVSATKHWESPCSIRDYLVAYIQEQRVIHPETAHNWAIVGADLDSPYREEAIKLVNEGKLDIPYTKSLNVNELLEAGIIGHNNE